MELGEITCPSGELVLMDGGYLELWSGDRSPDVMAAHEDLPAIDYEIVGPDAEAAARSFDRQPGRTLYDIPPGGELTAMFDAHCREHGLDASLRAFPERLSHRNRVRRAIGTDAPDFLITGVPVVPIGDVPTDRPLPVTAEPGEWGWSEIRIGLRDGHAVETRPRGSIGVDWARFVFADARALSAWEHHRPLDGLADVVFWGLDASALAAELDAPLTGTPGEEDTYGWLNLPVREAWDRAVALDERRQADARPTFAYDFRPHSHHWQVMAGVRASENEAATLTLGGAEIMMLMTSVGDGMFPVVVDVDDDGRPVAVRISVR